MKHLVILAVVLTLASCSIGHKISVTDWKDSVYNPDNQDFVVEVAFNLGISVDKVTQEQFNARYKED
jgi:hypothetical protein